MFSLVPILLLLLSLAAPPTWHEASWRAHVRPRLYAFARLVHRMRADSSLRYAYLLGTAEQRRAVAAARDALRAETAERSRVARLEAEAHVLARDGKLERLAVRDAARSVA